MKKAALYVSILFVVLIGAYIGYEKFYLPDNANQNPIINNNENQGTSGSSNSSGKGQTNLYKDGSYTGDAVDAFYGTVQVKVSIRGGKINNVVFLQYPDKPGHTIEVSNGAIPILKSETIKAQSANIDGVSGATQTAEAFIKSLSSALDQAKA